MFKKLIIFFIILLFVSSAAYIFFMKMQQGNVILGVKDARMPDKNIQENKNASSSSNKNIEFILENAKKALGEITSENVSSSSSKIEKIVNDLKNLQEIKKIPIDYICDSVCGGR